MFEFLEFLFTINFRLAEKLKNILYAEFCLHAGYMFFSCILFSCKFFDGSHPLISSALMELLVIFYSCS